MYFLCGACRGRDGSGVFPDIAPARALVDEVARNLDTPLTTSRGSVSQPHADLRFAPAGTPRYKDHLLLTAWHGADKKAGPTLWIRVDSSSAGFASGVAFTPTIRERWRAAVSSAGGARFASLLDELRERHARHEVELVGRALRHVPPPWCAEHLSELLPTHRWLVKHLFMEDNVG